MTRITPYSSDPKISLQSAMESHQNNIWKIAVKYQLHNKETNRNARRIIPIIRGNIHCLYTMLGSVWSSANIYLHMNPKFRNDCVQKVQKSMLYVGPKTIYDFLRDWNHIVKLSENLVLGRKWKPRLQSLFWYPQKYCR